MNSSKTLRKVTRAQLRTIGRKLGAEQGGKCPLCLNELQFSTKGAVVVDHNHETGEIRGALCRSCNAGEGKVANAVGRWIVGKMDYQQIIPALRRLADYLESTEKEGTGLMYPGHKTEEDKRAARAKKERARRAAARKMRARSKEQE
ncbi:putative endonuclease [Vibrio phage H256D1]|uniref:Endonuclease n=1 Tax=Vibrio phage H256D1 TaxID=2930329 RepID=A0AAE9HCD5_9CAUD|nr:putative endonuclease [Vibrio phage H256D1]